MPLFLSSLYSSIYCTGVLPAIKGLMDWQWPLRRLPADPPVPPSIDITRHISHAEFYDVKIDLCAFDGITDYAHALTGTGLPSHR